MQISAVKKEHWCSQKIVRVSNYLLGLVGIPKTSCFVCPYSVVYLCIVTCHCKLLCNSLLHLIVAVLFITLRGLVLGFIHTACD